VINGTLNVGNAARVFAVDDSLRPGAGDDLIVNAVIVSSSGGGITKNGFGSMVLTAPTSTQARPR